MQNKSPYIVFYACYTIVFAMMVGALCMVPQPELHFALNAGHSAAQDMFWRIYTKLAEWPLYVMMLWPLLLLAGRKKADKKHVCWMVGLYAIAEIVSTIVCQGLKYAFAMPRPMEVFTHLSEYGLEQYAYLDWSSIVVEGVSLHRWFSMPSGHTATFFVFFTMSMWLFLRKGARINRAGKASALRMLLALACLVCAFMGGFSRIYLSQHFLLDVCVGSAIGLISATSVYALFHKKIE